MSDQPRWPRGTPIAPSGRGPGGGRFRGVGGWVSAVSGRLRPRPVPSFEQPVREEPPDLSGVDLSSLLTEGADKSRSFGSRMHYHGEVHRRFERAATGSRAEAAVPLNEETLDEYVDAAAERSDEEFQRAMRQTDSLKSYGFYEYQPINALLRAGRGDIHAAPDDVLVEPLRGLYDRTEIAQTIADLHDLMDQSALTEDVVVYRGVGATRGMFGDLSVWRWSDRSDEWFPEMQGLRWRDHGFVSTGTTSDVVDEFLGEAHLPTLADTDDDFPPLRLRILVPAGTPALSRGERDGMEILLVDGLEFEIYTTYREDGHWQADVVVVGGPNVNV